MGNFVALKSSPIKSPNSCNLLSKVFSNALIQHAKDEVINILAKNLSNLLKGADMKTSIILVDVFKRLFGEA
jgi:hypothetical protein